METGQFAALWRDFVGLLLLPTLGVLGLMDRRAALVLRWTLGLWIVGGAIALVAGHTFSWSRGRFLRLWLVGMALGAAFLAIESLRRNRRVKPWLGAALALLTLLAFGQALLAFLARHS